MRKFWRIVALVLALMGLALLLVYSRARPGQEAPRLAARDQREGSEGSLAHALEPGAAGPRPPAEPARSAGSGAAPNVALPASATVSGSVVDALGGPVMGARVQARASVTDPVVASASSDERGAFALALPAGPHLIEAAAEAYSRAVVSISAPARELALVLVAESSIAGHVVTDSALPAAGVTVSVFNASGLRVPAILATSDEQGRFSVRSLPAGGYSISASSARFRGGPLWVNVGVGEKAEGLRLVVHAATAVTVQATIAGQPCRDGQILLATTPRAFGAFDADGIARLLGVLPGSYALTAFCRDALARTEQVTVGAQAMELAWALEPGLSVRGVVSSAAGARVPEVEVRVLEVTAEGSRTLTPKAIHRCISDATGAFACSGLTPGAYQVRAEGLREPRSEPVPVELSQGDVNVQLRLKPVGSIRAAFSDALQAERVLLHAFVRGADQWPIEGRRQDGEVWFQDLPLGHYEVFAGQPEPDAVQRVDLSADGQVAQVQLPVASLQSIAGTVRDERGVPVVEAWVRALTAPQVMKVATEAARPVLTDAQGAFWLDGLTPGQYEIVCTSGAGEGRARQVRAGVLDVRVAFTTYGSLSGTVETASGSPPPAFELEYARKGGPPGRVSGVDGRWSLPWLAPGEYDLHVRSDAGEAQQSVVLAPGGNVLVRSRLDVTR